MYKYSKNLLAIINRNPRWSDGSKQRAYFTVAKWLAIHHPDMKIIDEYRERGHRLKEEREEQEGLPIKATLNGLTTACCPSLPGGMRMRVNDANESLGRAQAHRTTRHSYADVAKGLPFFNLCFSLLVHDTQGFEVGDQLFCRFGRFIDSTYVERLISGLRGFTHKAIESN